MVLNVTIFLIFFFSTSLAVEISIMKSLLPGLLFIKSLSSWNTFLAFHSTFIRSRVDNRVELHSHSEFLIAIRRGLAGDYLLNFAKARVRRCGGLLWIQPEGAGEDS